MSTTEYASRGLLGGKDRFRHVLFLQFVQAAFSTVSSRVFLSARGTSVPREGTLWRRIAVVSLLSSLASPFSFAALKHISYPTVLLGKSCKLLPVLFCNVLIYRRKFGLRKYALVALVSAGIWAFMALGAASKHSKREKSNSVYGLGLLGTSLLLDGLVNSTQDQVFAQHKIEGPQMMFLMSTMSSLILFASTLYPFESPQLLEAIKFIRSHPSVAVDLLLYASTGAIGQLFIFRTLALFGSLTLVTVTVTRKMMTMLLSVFVFHHELTKGQWAGVAAVFAGVIVEATAGKSKADKVVVVAGNGTAAPGNVATTKNGVDQHPASNNTKNNTKRGAGATVKQKTDTTKHKNGKAE